MKDFPELDQPGAIDKILDWIKENDVEEDLGDIPNDIADNVSKSDGIVARLFDFLGKLM
ncbi:MAG: hypothetical protein OXI87_19000 [Albidovulum sp.]|nr:hypothetical protein [Albidovulum sp.]